MKKLMFASTHEALNYLANAVGSISVDDDGLVVAEAVETLLKDNSYKTMKLDVVDRERVVVDLLRSIDYVTVVDGEEYPTDVYVGTEIYLKNGKLSRLEAFEPHASAMYPKNNDKVRSVFTDDVTTSLVTKAQTALDTIDLTNKKFLSARELVLQLASVIEEANEKLDKVLLSSGLAVTHPA